MSVKHDQVVVGFDFSNSGEAALERAIALAALTPSNILHFVCAIEPHQPIPGIPAAGPIDYHYAEKVQLALTEEVARRLRLADITTRVHFYVHARIGKPADEILEVAREVGADLVIVGSKGNTGITRLVLGSVSERIVREAHCAVEVARPKTYAHVDLLQVVEVEPHHTYVPPHRYTYEEHRLSLRPPEWPLY